MTREEVIKGLECHKRAMYGSIDEHGHACNLCPYRDMDNTCRSRTEGNLIADALALLKAQEPITGETSDGYHTFNELYHHRAVLFSVIVANYPDRAWKSKKHHDGTMYDNMFIVGIDTPDGQATYHYDIDPYWDMFKCRVLDNAPEWDGHTPAQAIERIGKLKAQDIATIQPKRIELADETKAWLDEMDAVDALGNIANICIDWDGYRTANELGGLINEIWAYARYCADKLLKAQEPRVMTLEEVKASKGADMHLEISARTDEIPYITAATLDGVGTKGVVFYCSHFDFVAYNRRLYGWRCWTSRPTEEQREATPWE